MRLVAAFALFFLLNVVLDGIMVGTGGIATTRLITPITAASVTLNVANANGFLPADYVVIRDEHIKYTSRTSTTFTVDAAGRGYNGTTAVAHPVGAKVYNPGTSNINRMVGFTGATTTGAMGAVGFMAQAPFWVLGLFKLVTWNFAHFQVTPWLSYIRYIFVAISCGFTFWLIMQYAGTFIGGALSLFRR